MRCADAAPAAMRMIDALSNVIVRVKTDVPRIPSVKVYLLIIHLPRFRHRVTAYEAEGHSPYFVWQGVVRNLQEACSRAARPSPRSATN